MGRIALIAFFLTGSCLQAEQLVPPPFKGTLLSPSPYFPGRGHQQYELYTLWTEEDQRFNQDWNTVSIPESDTFTFFPRLKFGSSENTEIDLIPYVFYSRKEGAHAWSVGDCHVAFAIKLANEDRCANLGVPTVKLRIGARIPFGKYDRLDPRKKETDAGGTGNGDPNIGLLFGKYLHITQDHWVCLRAGYTFGWGTNLSIEGQSVYGDADKIGSRVHVGNRWVANLGWEATLMGKLALIGDLVARYKDVTRASKQKTVFPSSLVFTVAPGLEYDFSEQIGVLFGPSIDFAGRNERKEFSWLLSIKIHN